MTGKPVAETVFLGKFKSEKDAISDGFRYGDLSSNAGVKSSEEFDGNARTRTRNSQVDPWQE